MSLVRPITRSDIKGPALYNHIRDDFRKRIIELKRPRRVLIGDRVSVMFENRHTLTLQIEEMCRTENMVREDQIVEEISVYNEMMPTDSSLSATLFIELPHGVDAYTELGKLVGLDEHLVLHIGKEQIRAAFEPGRSTTDRISAVQYCRFPLTQSAKLAMATEGTPIAMEIDHPNYRFRTECPDATRGSLNNDFNG
jgi:hypothetical protein